MGQLVTVNRKPRRCNKSAILPGGSLANTILAAGEYMLVDTTNSKTGTSSEGYGEYDSYVVGDGSTTCSNLTIHSLVPSYEIDTAPTDNSGNLVSSGGVKAAIDALHAALTQSNIVPVAAADWPLSNLQQNTIYRVAGSDSYSDYMYDGSSVVLLSTYSMTALLDLDEKPSEGGLKAVEGGGIYEYGEGIRNSMWRTWPKKATADYGGWTTKTKMLINTSGVVTASGASSTTYKVICLSDTLSKGTVINFICTTTTSRNLKVGFTLTDPSTLASWEGLQLDLTVNKNHNGVWDLYTVVPYDNAYLVCYFYDANWSARTFEIYSPTDMRNEIDYLNSHLVERKTLAEFNHMSGLSTSAKGNAGQIYMLSSTDSGEYDCYVQANGVNTLYNCPFKFIGKETKSTTLGTYGSNWVRRFTKGNFILTSGIIYQGSTSGIDVQVRVFDVSAHNGEFFKLQFHRLATSSTGNNVGWSFFKKVYIEDPETGEPTEELVAYADYDFTNPENVLLCGTQPDPKTWATAYVVCPQDAYLLALTYYNSSSNTNGQKCYIYKLEPDSYAKSSALEPIAEQVSSMETTVNNTSTTLSTFLNGKDFVADDLVSVGRTAKKYIIKETGALYSGQYGAAGRFYVSSYIDVTSIPALSYKIKFYCKQNVAVIAAYNENYEYLIDNSVTLDLKSSAATASGVWERGENTRYIRIAIDRNYGGRYVSLVNSFPALADRVSTLENADDILPPVVERNPEAGAVITQMRYRGNTTGQNATSTTVLIHFSDIHGKTFNMKNIVAFREYYGTKIDDVINTGDTVANSFPNDTPQTVAGADEFLTAIGNHDVATYSSGSYNWTAHVGLDAYNKYIKPYMFTEEEETIVNRWGVTQPEDAETYGYCFYYKDYPSGVRLIVLDSMDSREAQVTWLESVLADAKTNGKTVVCAAHCVSGVITVIPCGMSNAQTTTGKVYGGTSQTAHLVAVQAFIDGGGKFACWLEGHAHTDAVGYLSAYPNQVVVRVAMAAYDNTQTAVSRISSDVSCDDFNIVCIDPANKWLQLCKVGSPFSRSLMRREPVTISYDTKKVIWPKVYSMMSEEEDEGDTDDN